MDILRKLSGQGQVYIDPDQQRHIGIEPGDTLIVRDDKGKHGNFLSIFKLNDNDREGVKEERITEAKQNGC